jgi:hypothetical protein
MPNFINCDIYEVVCCIKDHNNYFFDEFISENYVNKVCQKIYENLHIEHKGKVNFHLYLDPTT